LIVGRSCSRDSGPMSKEASKFATFIKEKKLDPRRILTASAKLEMLHPEDRKIRLERRIAKKAEGGEKKTFAKPRSGRPVTARAMAAAMTGGTVSGPTKTRLLKAVNHLLELKKTEKVQLKSLF
jgi:hypothetical protein